MSWTSLLTLAQNNVEVVQVTEQALGHTGLQKVVGFLYVAVCIGLVIAILTRTTKSEGLSGSMMGPSETTFSKKTSDDTIDIVTNVLAVGFLVMSLVMSYAFS